MVRTTLTRHLAISARVVVVLAVAGLLAAACAWRLSGGRWYVVQTPSMGRAAPVGTLLLTQPVAFDDLRVGDFITFRAPTSGEVFSHRVVAVSPAGLRTRGDINGLADPWTLTAKDLIGEVQARWWGCGWLLRAVPIMALAAALLWLLSSFVPRAVRSPVRVLGTSVTAAGVAAWLHPWTGLIKLGSSQDGGVVLVRGVSTGLLPIRVADAGGGHGVRLVSGQVAGIPVTHHDAHGAYNFHVSLALSLWWWVAVVALCLAPTLWTSLVGLPPADAAPVGRVRTVAGHVPAHLADGPERRPRPYAYRPAHAALEPDPTLDVETTSASMAPPGPERTLGDVMGEKELLWLA